MTVLETLSAAYQEQQKGNLQQAERVYRQILAQDPNHAEALHLLGLLAMQVNRDAAAVDLIARAIAIEPANPHFQNSLGAVYQRLGKTEAAVELWRKVLAIKPDYADSWMNLGVGLQQLKQTEEAITSFRRALELKPDCPEAESNLAGALAEAGRAEESIAANRRALALRPDYIDALSNLGHVLQREGRFDEAMQCYDRVLALNPRHAEAHFNRSMILLMRGDFARGWDEYEWRWLCPDRMAGANRIIKQRWDGSDLGGRTVLLHCEQGFGDAIHFIRYAPLVARRGGRVIVCCRAELMRLVQTADGVSACCDAARALPPFDVDCPVMSLPLVFRTTLQTIPCEIPYLHANEAIAAQWAERLSEYASGLRVGLVWAAGKPGVERSLEVLEFSCALARVANVRFISLQKGDAASQTADPPAGMRIADLSGHLTDFAETAGLIANLDLVISVDTAAAHLAGAMGKPVWLLLPFVPEWRWMQREDSPWYPTMRLFHQTKRREWGDVIERVAEALIVLTNPSGW